MSNIVCWIASSEFVAEAVTSALSAKQYLPDCKRVLFTLDTWSLHVKLNEGYFDDIISLSPRQSGLWYLDSVRYFGEVCRTLYGDNLLCLDTDTLLIEPCEELFDLLKRFDLALAHAPARQTADTVEWIPECFGEFNIGVTLFQANAVIHQFFNEWYKQYQEHAGVYGSNDQAPLREALWKTALPLRICTLTPEWNCRIGFGGFAAGKVKILHSRPIPDNAINHINDNVGMRGWSAGTY